MSIQFNSLPVNPLRITSPFGPRNTGIKGASTYHKGIDLGRNWNLSETPVYSVASGTVTNSYWNDVRGWVVIVDHGTFKTLYQHLRERGAAVGPRVVAGQRIGTMGATTKTIKGMTMHLHMELIYQGRQIDPEPYLKNIVPLDPAKGEDVREEYKTLEEVPQYFRPIVSWMMAAGIVAGKAPDNLGLTYDECRQIVWMYRAILVGQGKVILS